MKHRMLFGSAAALALCATTATAQVCQGSLPFTTGRTHVGAGLGFSDNTTSLGGGVMLGRSQGLYGGASLGLVNYDGPAGNSFTLGGGVGYAMPLAKGSNWQLCPNATLGFAFGPNNVGPTDADFSSQTVTAGASIGAPYVMSPKFTLVPFGVTSLAYAHSKMSLDGSSASNSDLYFLLGVGTGLQVSRSFVITPGLTFPIGADGADDVVFDLGVTLALPRRGTH